MKYKFLLIALVFIYACGTSSQEASDEDQELTNEETGLEEDSSSDPREISENQMEGLSATPPNEEEIGLPYYPGADYIPSSGTGGLLLMFATKDSPADVTEFYKGKLTDWTYNEDYGLFWEGSGDLGYAEIIRTKKTVAISAYTIMSYQSAVSITIPE